MKGGSRAGMTRRLGFSAPPAVDARGRGADGWDGRERAIGRPGQPWTLRQLLLRHPSVRVRDGRRRVRKK